jgi:alpha-ketoglutarate-dependent taurine dioxygenase
VGGETLWASCYAAYEKLSPGFRALIDGKHALYRSAHAYLDRDQAKSRAQVPRAHAPAGPRVPGDGLGGARRWGPTAP